MSRVNEIKKRIRQQVDKVIVSIPHKLRHPSGKILGEFIFDRKFTSAIVLLHKLNLDCVTREMEVYEDGVRPERGDIVMDVGAALGFYTVKAAREVGKNGLVVAIEPEPSNMKALSKIVSGCGLKNVICIDKAAGACKGKINLSIDSDGYSGHSTTQKVGDKFIEVEVDTLDNMKAELGLRKVDFVKIDAEGAELDILKGAEEILSGKNIELAIAAYHTLPNGELEFSKIVKFLVERGMEVWARDNSYVYAKSGGSE